jgi:hypothetical protein
MKWRSSASCYSIEGECDPVETSPCSACVVQVQSFIEIRQEFLAGQLYMKPNARSSMQSIMFLIILSGATAITSVLPFMRSVWSFITGASDGMILVRRRVSKRSAPKAGDAKPKDTTRDRMR